MRYEAESPSIFDALSQRYPEPAETPRKGPPSAPRRRRPPMFRAAPRSPQSTAGLVLTILVLFGCGGFGLFGFYRAMVETGSVPATEPSLRVRSVQPFARKESTAPPEPEERLEASVDLEPIEPRTEPERPTAPVPDTPETDTPETVLAAVETPEPAIVVEAPEPTVTAQDRPAVKIYSPKPDYPEAARLAGLSGTVIVEAEIDPSGSVSAARVLRGVSQELDQAAVETLRRWRFEPATSGGRPTTDVYRTAIRFELERPLEPEVAAASSEDDFEPPVRLYGPPPRYPPADWVAAVEGDVIVQAAVDPTGQVTGVEVLRGLSDGLNQAAVEALTSWRFRPARRQGEPVASHYVATFRFAR